MLFATLTRSFSLASARSRFQSVEFDLSCQPVAVLTERIGLMTKMNSFKWKFFISDVCVYIFFFYFFLLPSLQISQKFLPIIICFSFECFYLYFGFKLNVARRCNRFSPEMYLKLSVKQRCNLYTMPGPSTKPYRQFFHNIFANNETIRFGCVLSCYYFMRSSSCRAY